MLDRNAVMHDAHDLPSGTLIVFDYTIDIDVKIPVTFGVVLGRAINDCSWSYVIMGERRIARLSPQALSRRLGSGAARLLA